MSYRHNAPRTLRVRWGQPGAAEFQHTQRRCAPCTSHRTGSCRASPPRIRFQLGLRRRAGGGRAEHAPALRQESLMIGPRVGAARRNSVAPGPTRKRTGTKKSKPRSERIPKRRSPGLSETARRRSLLRHTAGGFDTSRGGARQAAIAQRMRRPCSCSPLPQSAYERAGATDRLPERPSFCTAVRS